MLMNIIIIGAGRGNRIMPYSKEKPKCFTEVHGKRILDRALDNFKKTGLTNIHFVGGYLIDVVKKEYPSFTFFHNTDWQQNNVLASLFYAEDAMDNGFICSYSDILFTSEIVEQLKQSSYDITIAVDTDWKKRYLPRTQHPMNDGEKVLTENDQIIQVSRHIPNDQANAEFIGVARFSPKGAALLRDYYHNAKDRFSGKPFQSASVFEKAYLIHLLQEMIEDGIKIHCVKTHGDYFEIDTVQDLFLTMEALKND